MATYKGVKIRVASDFSSPVLSVVEECHQTSEGKLFSTLNSISRKLVVSCEGRIEIFLDTESLNVYIFLLQATALAKNI